MATPLRASSRPAFIGASAAGALATGASLGAFGDAGGSVLGLIGLGAAGSLVVGTRRLPRGARHPWVVIAVAVMLTLVSAGLRDALNTVGDLTSSRSLLPDAFSAPGYVLLALGLALTVRVRRRNAGGGLDALLDGMLAGLAALALTWVFLIEPAMARTSATIGVRMSIVSYPPLSVVFVVVTSQLGFARGARRVPSIIATVLAMVLVLVGDVFFTLTDARVGDIPSWATLLPYGLAYSSIVFVALHPSFREYGEPLPIDNTPATPARLAFVALALVIPALVSVTHTDAALSDRAILGTILVVMTVTASIRMARALRHHARSEKALLHQATHDLLTGALNRAGLVAELDRLALHDTPRALLFLDMDRFKLVNDSFGHDFGDDLIAAVVDRLRVEHPAPDLIARIGGDEFVVVAVGLRDLDEVVAVAEELRRSFSQPFLIDQIEIPVSVSIGIAPADGAGDAGSLLRDADTAMYGAKDAGRDAVVVFDDSMRDRVSKRLDLERDLRHALTRGELAVDFQPAIDMVTGRAQGFEALMRWHHPQRGAIPPLEFIPIAEETGIIVEIGAWILDQALEKLALWRQMSPARADLWVSVNVSARQLRSADFVQMVERAIDRHELPPHALVLEVTESLLLEEGSAVPAILNRIRNLGIRLSIDDFGTGYSSLAYLQRFPFHCVKIDRAFVTPLDREGGDGDRQLVGAIVAMAEALGMTTLAEGVETAAQAQRLVDLGCTVAQGYLYSRPVPAGQIPLTLDRLERPTAPAPAPPAASFASSPVGSAPASAKGSAPGCPTGSRPNRGFAPERPDEVSPATRDLATTS